MNDIISKQRTIEVLKLIGAQRYLYKIAKNYQIWQFVLTCLIPVLCAILSKAKFLTDDNLLPYVSLYSLLIVLFDLLFINPFIDKKKKQAAVIQEEIDIKLFDLPWNSLIVDEPIGKEHEYRYAKKYEKKNKELYKGDWYPLAIENVPKSIAILICQRTNCTYDSNLRDLFNRYLIGYSVVCIVIFTIIAYMGNFQIINLCCLYLAPSLPLISFIRRYYKANKNTIERLQKMNRYIDGIWKKALIERQLSLPDLRVLQDALYLHRKDNNPIFDFFFNRKRKRFDEEMDFAAADMVSKFNELT